MSPDIIKKHNEKENAVYLAQKFVYKTRRLPFTQDNETDWAEVKSFARTMTMVITYIFFLALGWFSSQRNDN